MHDAKKITPAAKMKYLLKMHSSAPPFTNTKDIEFKQAPIPVQTTMDMTRKKFQITGSLRYK